jgi:hypothetical protein
MAPIVECTDGETGFEIVRVWRVSRVSEEIMIFKCHEQVLYRFLFLIQGQPDPFLISGLDEGCWKYL